MRGKRLVAVCAVVALAIGAGALAVHRRSANTRPPPSVPAPRPADAAPSEISLPGKIEPAKIVGVPAPMEGAVEQVFADIGEDVFEGEVLARIKSAKLDSARESANLDAQRAQTRVDDMQAALIAARLEASRARAAAVRSQGDLERAEKAYRRQEMLNREGATPRLVFEKALKEYEGLTADAGSFERLAQAAEDRVAGLAKELRSAQAELERKTGDLDEAKAELATGEVHAPADGIVVSRRVQAGDAVDRAMGDLFQIAVDLASLQVAISPGVKILARIHSGQPALVEVAEAPGGIPGTVREIRGGQVLVAFVSPTAAVRPGLTAQVKIRLT